MKTKYCDSVKLESYWFNWLLSSVTPSLEPFRQRGLLYTKVLKTNGIGSEKVDEYWGSPKVQSRSHCIPFTNLIHFESVNGAVPSIAQSSILSGIGSLDKIARKSTGAFNTGANPQNYSLGKLAVNQSTIDKLIANNYRQELVTSESWSLLFYEVQKICHGISLKFNLTVDEKTDLAEDALALAMFRIRERKIIYTPDKAPVFNLLTTTIHRIMYTILGKKNKDTANRHKHRVTIAAATSTNLKKSTISVRMFGSTVLR